MNIDVGESDIAVEQRDAPILPCSRPRLASAWLRLIASRVLPTPLLPEGMATIPR